MAATARPAAIATAIPLTLPPVGSGARTMTARQAPEIAPPSPGRAGDAWRDVLLENEMKTAATSLAGERVPRVARPSELAWIRDPFDPVRRMALLVGDPTRPGPYVVRMHVDAGYAIGLHAHPAEDEHLTVLSGSLHVSTGVAGSGAAELELPAGSVVVVPAGTPHRLWTTEETEIQMSGIGPRAYRYLDLAEDRRAPR